MSFDPNTLAHALTAHTEAPSGSRGVTHINGEDDETEISYSALHERALHVLYHLQQAGLQPGGHLVICTPSNEQFLDAFWACQLGGITAVPVAPGQTHQHRYKFFNVFRQLPDAYVFSNRATLEPLQAFAAEHGLSEDFDRAHARSVAANELSAALERGVTHNSSPTDIALVQFSSGSTGSPKGVLLSHANLLANVRAIEQWAAITQTDSWFCWAPLYHDMGLIACHLSPLVTGINQYFMPTERFARRPLSWLSHAAAKQATLLASPNFGLRHYLRAMQARSAADKLAALDLSHVRILFNAAEPISAELCEQFQAALTPYGLPADVIHPVYGLAEACVAVSFNHQVGPIHTLTTNRDTLKVGRQCSADGPAAQQIRLVGVGHPIPNCEVRLVDAAGDPVVDGVVGHLEIRGDNVTQGYFGQAAEQKRGAADWLDTGDLGVFEGELFIVGRAKDTIIVNGVTYHAHDLEGLCAQIGAIGPEKAVCTSVQTTDTDAEAVIVFVVYRGDMDNFVDITAAVKRALSEGALLDPHRIVPVRSLPRTTSGKLQRFALADAYLAGEFDAVLDELDAAAAARDGGPKSDARTEVERTLLGICRTYITTEEVYVDDDLLDKGTSSLALVEICEAVDECYPGVLDLPDFLEHTSIASLAAFLEERLEAESDYS